MERKNHSLFYKSYFETHEKAILEDFFSFLRFKSISTDPLYKEEVRACSKWVGQFLQECGFEVDVWETKNHPVIFATHEAKQADRPTLLIYQHYDVQPVDPLDLWESPPFEPRLKGQEVYARGACDNKGQCYYSLHALKAFMKGLNKDHLNIKVLIEGEEEIGSGGLEALLDKKQQELQADYVIIVDLGIYSLKQPAATVGFRGLITFEMECTGSSVDLHSGQFGGIAYNPLRGLAEVLSKVWDKDGKVTIDGFYEDIEPVDIEKLQSIDLSDTLKDFGLDALHKEKGYTQIESGWTRPTFEINGFSGGYTGPGFKTVIPAKAFCKCSCRLVPGQSPKKIAQATMAFFKKHIHKGFSLNITLHHGAEAFLTSTTGKLAEHVKRAYEEVLGVKAGFIMAGGSLPIAKRLSEVSKGETIGMGYAFEDDYVHAPNEHFGIDRLKYGVMTIGALLEQIAEEK